MCIIVKVKVIAHLEFELAYFEATVQHVSHTPLYFSKIIFLNF